MRYGTKGFAAGTAGTVLSVSIPVRRDGRLTTVPGGSLLRTFDFGRGPSLSQRLPTAVAGRERDRSPSSVRLVDQSQITENGTMTLTGNTSGARSNYANLDTATGGARLVSSAGTLRVDTLDQSGVFFHTGGGLQFEVRHVGSVVNRVYVSGNASGVGVTLGASGTDTDVDIRLSPKGAGDVDVLTQLAVAGIQVVEGRKTGWGAPTGTATRTTFATGSVTLPQLAERVKALIDDLTTHGLIGS